MRFAYIFPALILLFNIPVRAQKTDSLFLAAAIVKLQHAKEYSLKVANLMPAEKYGFKPTPEEMSFGKQLLHLSANMGWLSASYLSGSTNPVTKTDMGLLQKDEVMKVLSKSNDFALEVLKKFDVMHLADTVSFFAGPLNKLQIIHLLNDHQ